MPHRFETRGDNRIAAQHPRQEHRPRRPKSGTRRHENRDCPVRHPGRYSKGDERRKNEAAALDAVHEDRVLDTRHPSGSGGGAGRSYAERGSAGGDGRRFLAASLARAVLLENGPTLQNRVNDLVTEVIDEKTWRKIAEAQVQTLQSDLEGLRNYYNMFVDLLVPKCQETIDAEVRAGALDAIERDLHRDAMEALQAEHVHHIESLEAEFAAAAEAAKANFQRHLERMKGQGYHAGAPEPSAFGRPGDPSRNLLPP